MCNGSYMLQNTNILSVNKSFYTASHSHIEEGEAAAKGADLTHRSQARLSVPSRRHRDMWSQEEPGALIPRTAPQIIRRVIHSSAVQCEMLESQSALEQTTGFTHSTRYDDRLTKTLWIINVITALTCCCCRATHTSAWKLLFSIMVQKCTEENIIGWG